MTVFTPWMWFPHTVINMILVLDMFILYFLAIQFRCYVIVFNSSSELVNSIWSSAYSIVLIIFLLVRWMPLFITILNSCKILLMSTLNSTGERTHPCLTPLFVLVQIQCNWTWLRPYCWLSFICLYLLLELIPISSCKVFFPHRDCISELIQNL
jgi:hypothetical protein